MTTQIDKPFFRCRLALVLSVTALAAVALPVASSGAQSIDELNAQIADAQAKAQSLGADVQAKADAGGYLFCALAKEW